MADTLIAPELQARIDSVAARSLRSAAEVITDALQSGHSLEWQERYVDAVIAGRADIAAGRLATPADLERVRNKYRPTECGWSDHALPSVT